MLFTTRQRQDDTLTPMPPLRAPARGVERAICSPKTGPNDEKEEEPRLACHHSQNTLHSQDNGHKMNFHLRLSSLHLAFDIRATEMMGRTNVGVHINGM